MNKRFINPFNIAVGMLLAFIVFESVVYFQYKFDNLNFPSQTSDQTLQQYADKVLAACAGSSYHPACYDKQIPVLMNRMSMEDAFKVTRLIQAKDSSYPYCHVLGHELSAREVDKNPKNWKDVIGRCPSGMCSNGCIHGAFQEEFRSETFTPEQVEQIKPELTDVCEQRPGWSPTGLEQGSCYHALGHLTMYLTSAAIGQALNICNELGVKSDGRDFSQLCYDGAFMQIFQPLEPEDFSLIAGKQPPAGGLTGYCKKFTGNQRSSCWSEGWPMVVKQLMKPDGLVAHCSSNILRKPADSDRCYMAMFYVIPVQMKFDQNSLRSFCSALPSARSGECYGDAASRMIETDYKNIPVAVKFCGSANNSANQTACYAELVKDSTFNFHAGSAQINSLCDEMPEIWKNQCLAKS